MKELHEWESKLLESDGISEDDVTVALVRLPLRDGLFPAIILEPDTSKDQICKAWGGHIRQYRDRFYAQQKRTSLLQPNSFYKQLYEIYCEMIVDIKKGKAIERKTSYSDIAESVNLSIEHDLRSYIEYDDRGWSSYIDSLRALLGNSPKADSIIQRLLKDKRNDYLNIARHTLQALCKNPSKVEKKLKDALECIRQGESILDSDPPVTTDMVRYAISKGKRIAESTIKDKHNGVEKSG